MKDRLVPGTGTTAAAAVSLAGMPAADPGDSGWVRYGKSLSLLLTLMAAAVIGAGLSFSYYHLSKDAFERSKSEEKLTVLRLVDAMVNTYTDMRSDDAPVPATFRAKSIDSFRQAVGGNDSVRIGWIGVPGRQITVGPSDPQMAEWLSALASQPAPQPETRIVEVGEERLLRSVFPSVASQESCVSCHNTVQGGRQDWRLGDMMGAFVLDVPIGTFLDRLRVEAALLGVALFSTLFCIGAALRWINLRRADREVRQRLHARFAEAIENMADGFALYDERNVCVMANSAYRRRSGQPTAPAMPQPLEQRSRVERDGEGNWVKTDETLTSSGMVVRLQTDITALKARETELLAAKETAERASRARAEFLALMSHELRTPLNAIIGFSEVMRDNLLGELMPRYRDYAADINESGRHLLTIISDILDVAKADAGKMELATEETDIADIVEACRRLIAARAAQGRIALNVEVPSLLLWADQVKLKQIVINILANAVKFTAPGGHVGITATATESELALTVTDTGIGIAEHDLPRIMEPFVQLSTHLHGRGGTGLGLPLTAKLVELHGGSIRIDSRLGSGTSVTIALPRRLAVLQHLSASRPAQSGNDSA